MKRFLLFAASVMLIVSFSNQSVAAETFSGEAVKLAFESQGSSYVMYERTDVRRYDNGRYSGLVSREIKSMVNPIDPPKEAGFQNDAWYKGTFMVMEEANSSSVKLRPFNNMYPTTFHIASNGALTVVPGYNDDHTYRRDSGFPTYRSFPSYPSGEIRVGDSWTSTAYRAVDPLGTGIFTKLQIVVQYTYAGDETYKGTPCRKISAKWATRYGNGTLYHDYDGDPSLVSAQGTHNADIMVSVETGAAIVISDRYDETFTYQSGSTVRFAGTCTQFTEYTPAIDRNSVINTLGKIASVSGEKASDAAQADKKEGSSSSAAATGSSSGSKASGTVSRNSPEQPAEKSTADVLREALTGSRSSGSGSTGTSAGSAGSGSGRSSVSSGSSSSSSGSEGSDDLLNNMVVEEVDNGVRLSVRDIRFMADSARILSEEKWRLDAVAEVLKQLPGHLFLIEGHAASTGNTAGEQRLSVERAKTICEEMVKRGIPEEQLTYTGYGSTRPVADNRTSEGKAQNRRVEITILD